MEWSAVMDEGMIFRGRKKGDLTSSVRFYVASFMKQSFSQRRTMQVTFLTPFTLYKLHTIKECKITQLS